MPVQRQRYYFPFAYLVLTVELVVLRRHRSDLCSASGVNGLDDEAPQEREYGTYRIIQGFWRHLMLGLLIVVFILFFLGDGFGLGFIVGNMLAIAILLVGLILLFILL